MKIKKTSGWKSKIKPESTGNNPADWIAIVKRETQTLLILLRGH